MRVNDHCPEVTLKILSEKVSPKYISGGMKVNPIRPGQVLPNRTPIWGDSSSHYHIGDGEQGRGCIRPGMDDHKNHKGLENRGSAIYRDRGHQ